MLYENVIGLCCDHPDEGDDPEVHFLEWGITDKFELQRVSEKHGWTTVSVSGAPWRKEHYCSEHKPVPKEAGEEV